MAVRARQYELHACELACKTEHIGESEYGPWSRREIDRADHAQRDSLFPKYFDLPNQDRLTILLFGEKRRIETDILCQRKAHPAGKAVGKIRAESPGCPGGRRRFLCGDKRRPGEQEKEGRPPCLPSHPYLDSMRAAPFAACNEPAWR